MITVKQLQQILASAHYYVGVIDGISGPKTRSAVANAIESLNATLPVGQQFRPDHSLAAIQYVLKEQGFYLGKIDGFYGNLTESAVTEFETFQANGKTILQLTPLAPAPSKFSLYSTTEAILAFGEPGREIESRLISVRTPYALKLEWDLRTTVTSIRLHRLVASRVIAAMEAIAKAYSPADIERLRIDHFSGSYAHRRIRGGTSWSKHAFGIAVDFYAAANGLMTPWGKAAFSSPAYAPFVAAFEGQGMASLGKIMGRDAMHFEMAKGFI